MSKFITKYSDFLLENNLIVEEGWSDTIGDYEDEWVLYPHENFNDVSISIFFFSEEREVYPDNKDIFILIKEFIENDILSNKLFDEYVKLKEDMTNLSKFNIKNIFQNKRKENEIISKKIENINNEFHKNLFKHFPNELNNKYSPEWISKNIGKKAKLLL